MAPFLFVCLLWAWKAPALLPTLSLISAYSSTLHSLSSNAFSAWRFPRVAPLTIITRTDHEAERELERSSFQSSGFQTFLLSSWILIKVFKEPYYCICLQCVKKTRNTNTIQSHLKIGKGGLWGHKESDMTEHTHTQSRATERSDLTNVKLVTEARYS